MVDGQLKRSAVEKTPKEYSGTKGKLRSLCRQPPTPKRPRSRRFSPLTASLSSLRGKKTGNWRLVYAGWDDVSVVQPDGCGQARRGVEGRILPPGRPPVMRNGPPSVMRNEPPV